MKISRIGFLGFFGGLRILKLSVRVPVRPLSSDVIPRVTM